MDFFTLPEFTLPLNSAGDVSMTFIKIPAGVFWMGSKGYSPDEEPVHRVRLQTFWLGITPVTCRQYSAWQGGTFVAEKGEVPRTEVSWKDARNYCTWLNGSLQSELQRRGISLRSGWSVHAQLPSEAQWEYACRAGTETDYHSGNGEKALRKVAWFDEEFFEDPRPVQQKYSNRFGLWDMHGNLYEWCRDSYDLVGYQKLIVCSGHLAGTEGNASNSDHVIRGGPFWGDPGLCRSSIRTSDRSVLGKWIVGFRVALVPSTENVTPDHAFSSSPAKGTKPERPRQILKSR